LGGVAPQILTDVLGGRLPLSGIDIGGFGALGGLDFDLALASTFMSTAAAFLECDPKPECPIEDTYNFGTGGSSKEESKDEKVNTNNIVDKVKNVGGSAFAADKQLNDRIQEGIESTGIPTNLPAGSFGISAEGTSEAINNRVEKLTGIPANLPEGAFTITPKNKFNVPKIKKVIEEEKIDSLGNSTTIEYEDTVVYPEGQSYFKGSETTSIEVENGQVIIKEKKNIQTRLEGKTYSTLFIDSPDGTRTINPNPQFFILGVEVTLEGWEAWRKLPFPEDVERAEEFANRYRK
jgi:hypothetical protein